jgi:hemoglobin-like flavoprotein
VNRIAKSYDQFSPRAGDMVAGFYQRLFTACPEARPLFREDMSVQRNHFTATLALLVRNLAFQDMLEEAVMDLGAQHVRWGARLQHYPIVRDALLDSIGESLGEGWTPQLQDDWRTLIDQVVATMQKGAMRMALREASGAAGPG